MQSHTIQWSIHGPLCTIQLCGCVLGLICRTDNPAVNYSHLLKPVRYNLQQPRPSSLEAVSPSSIEKSHDIADTRYTSGYFESVDA